jgi:hypothetical protein
MAVGKLLGQWPMQRFSALLLCLMLVLSLGFGSVAHAAEGATCVEATSVQSADHVDGDADQVPADADKAYPHHHGGCHSHQVGVPIAANPVALLIGLRVPPAASNVGPMALAPLEAALRPPQV